jgi:hypothetical protein
MLYWIQKIKKQTTFLFFIQDFKNRNHNSNKKK